MNKNLMNLVFLLMVLIFSTNIFSKVDKLYYIELESIEFEKDYFNNTLSKLESSEVEIKLNIQKNAINIFNTKVIDVNKRIIQFNDQNFLTIIGENDKFLIDLFEYDSVSKNDPIDSIEIKGSSSFLKPIIIKTEGGANSPIVNIITFKFKRSLLYKCSEDEFKYSKQNNFFLFLQGYSFPKQDALDYYLKITMDEKEEEIKFKKTNKQGALLSIIDYSSVFSNPYQIIINKLLKKNKIKIDENLTGHYIRLSGNESDINIELYRDRLFIKGDEKISEIKWEKGNKIFFNKVIKIKDYPEAFVKVGVYKTKS